MVAKKDLYPTQLSGGQQQLVAVARSVMVTHSEQNATYGNRIINLKDGWLV